MSLRHLAALLLCVAVLACTQPITGRARTDETTTVPSEQPALQRAAEKAQATLDDFLTKAKRWSWGRWRDNRVATFERVEKIILD